MKRKLSTALVMLLAFALLLGTTAITASAETTYTSIGGTTDLLVKNLVVDDDANIPNITFSYTIRRDNYHAATDTTIEILEASAAGSIGTAAFSNADTAGTINGLPSDPDPDNSPTEGKKYAQKSVSITFPDGSFTKPGVYRYVINETNDHLPGVTYDSNSTRYLDVFVVADESNVLHVQNYVFHSVATDISKNGNYVEDPGVKSSAYTNSLTQYDFDFSKTISGNQGDKNKRFNFTLSITGANPGTYPIRANDVTGNPTSITVDTDGTATGKYSLTNGSTVKVVGLNAGAVCTVTENPDYYTATYRLDSGEENSGAEPSAVTLDRDHSVAFTNTRNGIIPTGIIMTIAPFAIGICVFGAVFIFIICRKKSRRY